MTKVDWIAAGAIQHQAAQDWSMTKKRDQAEYGSHKPEKYKNIFFQNRGPLEK